MKGIKQGGFSDAPSLLSGLQSSDVKTRIETMEKFQTMVLSGKKLNTLANDGRVKLMSQCVNVVKDNNPKLVNKLVFRVLVEDR